MRDKRCTKCLGPVWKRGHASRNREIQKWYCPRCKYYFEHPLTLEQALIINLGISQVLSKLPDKK